MTEFEFHPLAKVFPLLSGKEFREFIRDIRTRGQLEPITLYENKVLDGRNRYRACQVIKIDPITKVYDGTDPLGFVFSKNLYRRHLNESQRAMAMVESTKLLEHGDVATQMDDPSQDGSQIMTADQAARLAQVSTATIERAKVVQANGTEAEIASIKNGHVTVREVERAIRARKVRSPGARIVVPKQYAKLSDAVRAGIEIDVQRSHRKRGDISYTQEVHEIIGLKKQTYVQARDIVLLADRNDLSEKDAKIVQAVLRQFDETRQIGPLLKKIRPIALKVWGRKGNRFKADKRRFVTFFEAISFIQTTCTAVNEIEIPVLEKTQRNEAIKQVRETIAALRALHRRIGGTPNK